MMITSHATALIFSYSLNTKLQAQLQDGQLGQQLKAGLTTVASSVQSKVQDPELQRKVRETASTGE